MGSRAMSVKKIPSAIFSVGFACSLVFGYSLERTRGVNWHNPLLYMGIAVLSTVVFVAVRLLFKVADKTLSSRDAHMHASAGHAFSVRWRVLCLALVTAGWVVVWLASWPGYFCYDTIHVISFLNTGSLNNQQPVLHTLFCSLFVWLGHTLFGMWNAGVALFMCAQLCLLIAIVNGVLGHLAHMGVSRRGLLACSAYYALNPAVFLLVTCSAKDVLCAAFLTYACVVFFELLCMGKQALCPLRSCVLAGLSLFVVLACRTNVLYAFVASLPFAALFNRRSASDMRRALLVVSGCALVGALVWNGPVATLLDVYRADSRREMISIPAVEITRCAQYDDWGEEEFAYAELDREWLGSLYGLAYHTSDACRVHFWPLVDQNRMGDVLRLWMAARKAHFSECVVADLELTEPAWYVGATQDGYNVAGILAYGYSTTDSCTFAAWCEEPARQESLLPGLSDALWYLSRYDTPSKLPVVHVLLSPATYVWVFLLAMALMFERGSKAGKTVCAFLFFVLGTLLLGPMVILRYYYHLVLLAPVLLCLGLCVPAMWGESGTCEGGQEGEGAHERR